jgi:hypothetical protein
VRWKKRSLKQALQEARRGKSNHYQATPYYSEVACAHYWNVLPSQMGLCDAREDAAVMLAYWRTATGIEELEGHLQRLEMEKNRLRKGSRRK